jgi:hypothetical protein
MLCNPEHTGHDEHAGQPLERGGCSASVPPFGRSVGLRAAALRHGQTDRQKHSVTQLGKVPEPTVGELQLCVTAGERVIHTSANAHARRRPRDSDAEVRRSAAR